MTLGIILQAANAGTYNLILILAMVAVMYFVMIRPQQKKQKAINKFRSELKVGDKVITAGGIQGKIKHIEDEVVSLEIADNVKIRINKSFLYATANDMEADKK